ncbi:MAG: stage sporulation protein [Clostridia bacterium]|nr:stage sporulation protein [Clostridia bacterium]
MRRFLGLFIILVFIFVIIIPTVIIEGTHLLESPVEVKSGENLVRVYLHRSDTIEIMPMEEYLVGVVAGEMPASFEMEALKAQAIAARTYTYKRIEEAKKEPNKDHPGADICTDPAHCQAWASDDVLRKRWGLMNFWRYKLKIREAVRATRGMVLTYKGELIDPVYHSNSGGRTESAAAVWGGNIPYLQSVPSPWDKSAPHYLTNHSFSLDELEQKLGIKLNTAVSSLPSAQNSLIKVKKKTATGRLKEVQIGDKIFDTVKLRQLLGLSSTNFTWQISGNKITFYTVGYGHGVGMSQYGANGMAKEGKKFNEILGHYYQGVKLRIIKN